MLRKILLRTFTGAAIVVLLAGCDDIKKPDTPRVSSGQQLRKMVDEEAGVVCYRADGWNGISCIPKHMIRGGAE